jgi:hypothetical protein
MLQDRTAAILTRCERPSAEPSQADLGGIIAARSLPERSFNERRPVGRIARVVPVDLGVWRSSWNVIVRTSAQARAPPARAVVAAEPWDAAVGSAYAAIASIGNSLISVLAVSLSKLFPW